MKRRRGRVTALNGSGRSPVGLSLDRLRNDGFEAAIPPFHAHTITVPGAAAGWCDLVESHGSMAMQAVLKPAIDLAEQGFPVAPITAYYWGAWRSEATRKFTRRTGIAAQWASPTQWRDYAQRDFGQHYADHC